MQLQYCVDRNRTNSLLSNILQPIAIDCYYQLQCSIMDHHPKFPAPLPRVVLLYQHRPSFPVAVGSYLFLFQLYCLEPSCIVSSPHSLPAVLFSFDFDVLLIMGSILGPLCVYCFYCILLPCLVMARPCCASLHVRP